MFTTKKDAVLDLLYDLRWHTNAELNEKTSWRFGASICMLRDEGYDIETRRSEEVKTKFDYRLKSRKPCEQRAKDRFMAKKGTVLQDEELNEMIDELEEEVLALELENETLKQQVTMLQTWIKSSQEGLLQ